VTKLFTVVPSSFGSSACNLLHVALLVPRILRRVLDFEQFMYLMLSYTLIMLEEQYLGQMVSVVFV
jgi:hypothetical protein